MESLGHIQADLWRYITKLEKNEQIAEQKLVRQVSRLKTYGKVLYYVTAAKFQQIFD